MAEIKNPFAKFEKNKNDIESKQKNEISESPLFDYSQIVGLTPNDETELIKFEKILGNSIYAIQKNDFKIGESLFKAQEKLSAYKTGTFMEWYQKLGFNKDKVSNTLKRYNLYLENPNKKDLIMGLPVVVVKEATKKDFPDDLKKEINEKIFDGEIKTVSGIKEIEEEYYSHNANNKKTKKLKEKPTIRLKAISVMLEINEVIEEKQIKDLTKEERKELIKYLKLFK